MGRRPTAGIALVGYALAAIAKPLIGLSTGWLGVLGARSLDRLGSGVRSAPRDALVAASADEKSRGKAFGLEGAGDNLGAFLGPLVTLALITLAAVSLPSVFFIAFVPGLLAVLMVLLVREKPVEAHAKAKLDVHLGRLPKRYWAYLGVTAVFGIGNSSNAFLIRRVAMDECRSDRDVLVPCGVGTGRECRARRLRPANRPASRRPLTREPHRSRATEGLP